MVIPIQNSQPAPSGYAEVADRLRQWIVGERLPPGTALPRQIELAEHFAVSNLTIGRAMRQLQDDGLIVATRRAGSFVAPSPPHLHRYALVFPQSAGSLGTNRFMQALANEAARLTETGACTVACFHELDGRRNVPDYQRLLADIQRRRLAGIIFATPPFLLAGTPVLTAPGIARAAIVGDNSAYRELAKVTFTEGSFARRALARLQAQGRRRVAVISGVLSLESWVANLAELAPAHGMETRPYWAQGVALHERSPARRLAHLLFHAGQDQRPDALIVADDNILEAATAGLRDAGVEVPRELTVIAHANFPWPTPAQVPVCRLGFDAAEVLRCLIAGIDRLRAGEPPGLVTLPPLFDEEYQARRVADSPAAPFPVLSSPPLPVPQPVP